MLDCLENKVAWIDACDSIEAGKFYINDLPGYPSRAFELLTNQDSTTAKSVYEKILRRSKQAFKTEIERAMSGRFQVQTIVSSIRTGNWQQPFENLSLSAGTRGQYISLVNSDHLQVFIENIELYVQGALTSTIYFQDLDTGENLHSIEFSTVSSGFANIEVNKVFSARRLYAYYDKSVIESRKINANDYEYYARICKPCGCNATQSNSAESSLSSGMIYSDLSFGGNSGMIVRYSLQCGLDKWICQNQNILAPLFLYWLGIELATETVASDRVNEVTLQSPEKIDSFVGYCNNEFQKGIEQLSKGAQIKDSICVPCAPKVQKFFNIP